jgi:hypothetical protein
MEMLTMHLTRKVFKLDSLCNIQTDKLITGSYQGFLRIYSPQSGEFKSEQLLYEQQLEAPILQIALGRFLTYLRVPISLI